MCSTVYLLGERERRTVATMKVIERRDAHYEVQDVPMGNVYRWCPEKILVECNCGETPTLAASATTCGKCGKDHALLIQEVLNPRSEDEIEYPWRYLQPYTPMRGA
jgi:hypothetical protein